MSFANPSISDLAATTIDFRNGEFADNVLKNNALLAMLEMKGRIKPIDGGITIYEELAFQENANAMFYSGADLLATAAQDVLSAAQYPIKQAAVMVPFTGLEVLSNSGKEKKIALVESRVEVAEASIRNLIAQGLYSDGTGFGGKQITGLGAGVVASPTTGTYGGIDRSAWTFWRNQVVSGTALTTSNINAQMNTLWAKCVRGSDHPDLVVFDNTLWALYVANQQQYQRFGDGKLAQMGFTTLKFMSADVVLDGGVGGFATSSGGYFLNTKYLKWRPHKDRNFSSILGGKTRASINQDVELTGIGFAGNLTCSNASLQGYLSAT